MIHVECDGCGQTAPQGKSSTKAVVIVIDGMETRRDLCLSCLTTLKRQAEPLQWPRVGPAKSA